MPTPAELLSFLEACATCWTPGDQTALAVWASTAPALVCMTQQMPSCILPGSHIEMVSDATESVTMGVSAVTHLWMYVLSSSSTFSFGGLVPPMRLTPCKKSVMRAPAMTCR